MRIHRGYKVYVISSIRFQWAITSFWVGFPLSTNRQLLPFFCPNGTRHPFSVCNSWIWHIKNPQIRWFTRQNKFNLMQLMFSLWWQSHFKFVEYLFEIAMMYPMNISIVADTESEEIWNSYLRNTWWICKVIQSISVTHSNFVSLKVLYQFFVSKTTTL